MFPSDVCFRTLSTAAQRDMKCVFAAFSPGYSFAEPDGFPVVSRFLLLSPFHSAAPYLHTARFIPLLMGFFGIKAAGLSAAINPPPLLQLASSSSMNRTAVVFAGATAVAAGSYLVYRALARRSRPPVPSSGPWTSGTLPDDAYVACVVGAGPAGSTAAFYLAKAGARVVLCEKEAFPRDKVCGDALCTPSHPILQVNGHYFLPKGMRILQPEHGSKG